MTKKNCPPGRKWDNVVTTCIQDMMEIQRELKTEPTPVFHQKTSPTAWSDPISLSPILWIAVVLTTLGTIMALALWMIFFRWESRFNRTSAAEPEQDPAEKIDPLIEGHEFKPSVSGSTSFDQTGPLNISKSQKATSRGETDSAQQLGGFPLCNSTREHKIPLPATELGGTVLVTTKTL
ncbi:uncharacterized protein LOC144208216 isoform X2 [Stigmatopora nigra]